MSAPHTQTTTRRAGAPVADARLGIVLLHGRGASADSVLGLGSAIASEDVAIVAPQADAGSWYPFSFLAPLANNEPALSGALARVEREVAALEGAGLQRAQIVLAGFSQGACLALEFAARAHQKPAAVIAFSGGLIGSGQLPGLAPPNDKAFDYPPVDRLSVFLGCSNVDAHIPLERVEKSASVLLGVGAQVDVRIYPGMGHTINHDELKAARDLLEQVGR